MAAIDRRRKLAALGDTSRQHQNRWSAHSGTKVKVDRRPHEARTAGRARGGPYTHPGSVGPQPLCLVTASHKGLDLTRTFGRCRGTFGLYCHQGSLISHLEKRS